MSLGDIPRSDFLGVEFPTEETPPASKYSYVGIKLAAQALFQQLFNVYPSYFDVGDDGGGRGEPALHALSVGSGPSSNVLRGFTGAANGDVGEDAPAQFERPVADPLLKIAGMNADAYINHWLAQRTSNRDKPFSDDEIYPERGEMLRYFQQNHVGELLDSNQIEALYKESIEPEDFSGFTDGI